MLQPHALLTVPELNPVMPATFPLPAEIRLQREEAINGASTTLEGICKRRLVFRAPPEFPTADNVVALVAIADGLLTIAGQPGAPGRTLRVEKVDADFSITAGLLTATGTVNGITGTPEVFDLSLGPVLHGLKFFTAMSGIAISGAAVPGAADKVKIGTSEGYLEYHTIECGLGLGPTRLYTYERPVRQLLLVNEDWARVYAAGTQLVAGTDYQLSGPEGILTRLSPNVPRPWQRGFRSVKTILSAGYFTSAEVHPTLKKICRQLAALSLAEVGSNRVGLSGGTDSKGNWTRFSTPKLDDDMEKQLFAAGLVSTEPYRTAERDFSLEAA